MSYKRRKYAYSADPLAVGFTGTQAGLLPRAKEELSRHLIALREQGFITLHHGDCVGADAMAHDIAKHIGYRIIIHPPFARGARAFKVGAELHRPMCAYLERNKNIVLSTARMIACPKDRFNEELRSGTWSTVRFARKKEREIILISARVI